MRPAFANREIELQLLLQETSLGHEWMKYETECTFGVRSACRKTVTFALSTQVGTSEVVGVVGNGLSNEDNLIHSAAKMSAALSAVLLLRCLQ